ncbi:MAG: class I SAM-dependent methyltransferase [Opitutaceae bacterium]|nr:class I SAM-dependent methyltransferase [Opitutaceae bacterium]
MSLPTLPTLSLSELARRFQWPAPPVARNPGWAAWNTEVDDALILRYLYQNHQPRRHLEFGTWQGFGTCLCLESCAATVWTLNLPDGEAKADGSWAYGHRVTDESSAPAGAVSVNFGQDEAGPRTYHRTDAASYIGRIYREKQLGHRVCQVYCDSRAWDTSAYTADFFDSVLVDGGHSPEVVISDSRKALSVLRPGGLILWHDVCPDPAIIASSTAVQGVMSALESLWPELERQCSALFWIDPSYILLGIKK